MLASLEIYVLFHMALTWQVSAEVNVTEGDSSQKGSFQNHFRGFTEFTYTGVLVMLELGR